MHEICLRFFLHRYNTEIVAICWLISHSPILILPDTIRQIPSLLYPYKSFKCFVTEIGVDLGIDIPFIPLFFGRFSDYGCFSILPALKYLFSPINL